MGVGVGGGGDRTIEKGVMGEGENSFLGGRGMGGEEGGQLRSWDELIVNSLFILQIVFFIQVFVTWYFKNCCVNWVFTHVQL